MNKDANAASRCERIRSKERRSTHPSNRRRSRVHSRNACRTNRSRRAFTLLELLLTLALTMALMVAVSSSLYGYYRWRDAGERQIEQGRTWLALTRAIEDDLLTATRSMSMTPGGNEFAERIGSNGVNNSGSNFGEEQIAERVLNFGYEFSLEPLLLYGDSSFMALGQITPTTSRTPPPMNKRALTQTVVIWTSKSTGSLRVPFADQSDLVSFGSISTTNRSTIDLIPRSHMENSSASVSRITVLLGDTLQMGDRVIYPPQFQEIRFRYLDGERWVSSWNSQRQGRLPSAVEVRVQRSADTQIIRRLFEIDTERWKSETTAAPGLVGSSLAREDES